MIRLFWFALGGMSLALSIVGIFLPLLPTTPFLLVAAFAFARSSPRVHTWLIEHAHLGPLIRNWQGEGAIARRDKIAVAAAIIAVLAISIVLGVNMTILVVQGVVLSLVALFVLTRPGPAAEKQARVQPDRSP